MIALAALAAAATLSLTMGAMLRGGTVRTAATGRFQR
jgi:hypothetical protein